MAPSTLPRKLVDPLLHASLKMAQHLKYKGLGTFEYLVNANSGEWVFLEINPRIQVEHTVTGSPFRLDLPCLLKTDTLLQRKSRTLT